MGEAVPSARSKVDVDWSRSQTAAALPPHLLALPAFRGQVDRLTRVRVRTGKNREGDVYPRCPQWPLVSDLSSPAYQ